MPMPESLRVAQPASPAQARAPRGDADAAAKVSQLEAALADAVHARGMARHRQTRPIGVHAGKTESLLAFGARGMHRPPQMRRWRRPSSCLSR